MAIKHFNRERFERELKLTLSPTTPIRSPSQLRGREKLLEDIRRALVQPGRHIFIHGDRGVGKTSLAQTAGLEHQSNDRSLIFLGCDNASTFYKVAQNIARRLAPGENDPTVSKVTRSGKLGIGFKILTGEAQQTVERGGIPSFGSIDDAITVINYLASQRPDPPVIVIDEFDRIRDPADRMLFADFIKQVGDQSVPVKLVFCGIGTSLDELLDAHHSCYRYLTAVPLERLGYQPRLEIIRSAAEAFGLVMEETSQYRIAMISDGFPHYVHLLTEKLLWEVFVDPKEIATTEPRHYSAAVAAAVVDIEPHLKAMYEKASQKYKADYEHVLWAVADDHELQRRSTDIYDSYLRIVQRMPSQRAEPLALEQQAEPPGPEQKTEPLAREAFNQRMNSLKRPAHAEILRANRQGWYRFKEAVVRGYVRLRAEDRGVELGRDHPLDGRDPRSLANAPTSNVFRSRD
jgi:uncharacterized protein